MPVILTAQVRFSAVSGKTEDDITNTFHFQVETTPPPAGTLTAIGAAIGTFYSTIQPSCVNDWAQAFTVKYYNVADPHPRAPIYTSALGGAAWSSGAKNVIREQCTCLSFKGSTLSGVPMGRRRGRVFLPPTRSDNIDDNGRFNTAWVTTVKNAGNTLLNASDAAADWSWVIYSKATGSAVPVIGGWCDNAPDIQRRRGLDATARQNFP